MMRFNQLLDMESKLVVDCIIQVMTRRDEVYADAVHAEVQSILQQMDPRVAGQCPIDAVFGITRFVTDDYLKGFSADLSQLFCTSLSLDHSHPVATLESVNAIAPELESQLQQGDDGLRFIPLKAMGAEFQPEHMLEVLSVRDDRTWIFEIVIAEQSGYHLLCHSFEPDGKPAVYLRSTGFQSHSDFLAFIFLAGLKRAGHSQLGVVMEHKIESVVQLDTIEQSAFKISPEGLPALEIIREETLGRLGGIALKKSEFEAANPIWTAIPASAPDLRLLNTVEKAYLWVILNGHCAIGRWLETRGRNDG